MVHLMVDHFTIFAVTGESAANQQAKRTLRILAYVTPLEANSYCAVRVYCVGDTEAAVEVREVRLDLDAQRFKSRNCRKLCVDVISR